MNKFLRFSIAAIAAMTNSLAKAEEIPSFYNPGEEQGSFDLIMKPYEIPVETTTYVDFFFNIPDNLPDLFHVVMGEVVNSQPLHLHHFVITGCTEKVDPEIEGMPVEFDDNFNCFVPLGGWAPGADVFGNLDNEAGILMGKAFGIQAIQLNVHYTDGEYENPETKTKKIATDGIRVHYTPDFRPYTSASKALINVGFATKKLMIPAGEERFFITKTCKVNTSCKDSSPELIQNVIDYFGMDQAAVPDDISCPSIKLFCNIGGDIGSFIQRLCPMSCGFCEGEDNPMNPDRYRLTGINYHAHLLGREMYTTLVREEEVNEGDESVAIQKVAQPPTMQVKDLQSKPFWIYDFQETYALDYEDFVHDETNEILRGTDIRPGDKIQVACVYDSTNRDEDTRFSISTYDEMCITTATITFETPASLLTNTTTGNLDILTQLSLMSFSCDEDEETDIYTGTLAAGEDGKDIWKNHPISDSEGCTFPTFDLAPAVFQTRNCPEDKTTDSTICRNLENVQLVFGAVAGASCGGGVHNERDANDGLTEDECVSGGGTWTPYTCGQLEAWVEFDGVLALDDETMEWLRVNWWQDKCCSDVESEEYINDSSDSSDDVGSSSSNLDSAASIASRGSLLAFVSAAALAMIL